MNTDGKVYNSAFIDPTKVSSKHEPPEPCRTLPKPTPAEALQLKIKLPWEDKVQRMRPADLTKELFLQLDEYGLTRTEIMNLFRCYAGEFYALMKEWGVPPATPGGKKKALRSGNFEPVTPTGKAPIDLSRSYHDTAPGKTRAARLAEIRSKTDGSNLDQAIRTEKEIDAELERIDKRLEELGCKTGENYSKEYSPKPAEIIPDKPATSPDIVMVHADPVGTMIPVGLTKEAQERLARIRLANEQVDRPHAPTNAELEDVFRDGEANEAFDLSGWDEYLGGISRFQSLGNRLSVSRDIYVGKDVDHIREWGFCAIMVKPDGQQVALKKTDSGALVGKKTRCIKITCKAAVERVHALVGGPAQYIVESAKPDLVIFRLCQEKGKVSA